MHRELGVNSPAGAPRQTFSSARRMTLRSWKPVRKGSLIGFAGVDLPIGLQIDDIVVMAAGSTIWATLPARPVLTTDGRVARLPGSSKPHYVSILRWRDRKLSAAFSRRVVELVREQHPDAFENGDAAKARAPPQ